MENPNSRTKEAEFIKWGKSNMKKELAQKKPELRRKRGGHSLSCRGQLTTSRPLALMLALIIALSMLPLAAVAAENSPTVSAAVKNNVLTITVTDEETYA